MLPPDLTAATFQLPNAYTKFMRPGEELDEIDDSNVNSVLAVADDLGNIYAFLDGSYSLGVLSIGEQCGVASFYKSSNTRYFIHSTVTSAETTSSTQMLPSVIDIPYLQNRIPRDVARVSSSSRELAWYTYRVIKEMRAAWFGSDINQGAREVGPKWLRALEERQRQKFGRKCFLSRHLHLHKF